MNANGTAALITVSLDVNPYSGQALADVGGPIRSAADGSIPGATVLVGGATSQSVDVRNAIDHDLSVIFPVAALIIAVILGLLLRAVIGPLYLLLGVGLGFLATLGILVLIFQKAAGLVGLDFSIPIVLYLFVVAIGTDYNILMTARVREELRAGKDPADAVGQAIAHGGADGGRCRHHLGRDVRLPLADRHHHLDRAGIGRGHRHHRGRLRHGPPSNPGHGRHAALALLVAWSTRPPHGRAHPPSPPP